MNTTTTDHVDVLRELSEILGATSFVDYGHVCYFSKNPEWYLYVNHKHDSLYYIIGVRIPSEASRDVRASLHLQRICPSNIRLPKTKSAKILANAIRRHFLPDAVEFAQIMWRTEEEYRNYQATSANTIARAAQIIGAKAHAKILNGNLGCHHCTARISGAQIELTISNLDADRLAKIAAVIKT